MSASVLLVYNTYIVKNMKIASYFLDIISYWLFGWFILGIRFNSTCHCKKTSTAKWNWYNFTFNDSKQVPI